MASRALSINSPLLHLQLRSIISTWQLQMQPAGQLAKSLFRPLLPLSRLSIPVAIQLNIPSILSDIWGSILRAVPKKKTSYMKKRSRFMAGKALQDVQNINKCSSCGKPKRAHILCPYCVEGTSRSNGASLVCPVDRSYRD